MNNEIIIDTLGWVGGIEMLIAYGLVSTKRLNADSVLYQALNFTGSIFLIINTYYHHAFPSAVVNGIWTLIAVYSFFQFRKKEKNAM